jgi:hypothetical protein
MDNEKEILYIEKGKDIIDKTKKIPKKKSFFKRFELHIYIIGIFILVIFFFFIPYLIQNQLIQIKKN